MKVFYHCSHDKVVICSIGKMAIQLLESQKRVVLRTIIDDSSVLRLQVTCPIEFESLVITVRIFNLVVPSELLINFCEIKATWKKVINRALYF